MYILGVDHVMDMPFNDPQTPVPLSYGDIFRQTEEEYARWNFDTADTAVLLRHFEEAEAELEAAEHESGDASEEAVEATPASLTEAQPQENAMTPVHDGPRGQSSARMPLCRPWRVDGRRRARHEYNTQRFHIACTLQSQMPVCSARSGAVSRCVGDLSIVG